VNIVVIRIIMVKSVNHNECDEKQVEYSMRIIMRRKKLRMRMKEVVNTL
jgi:hypothetical protein